MKLHPIDRMFYENYKRRLKEEELDSFGGFESEIDVIKVLDEYFETEFSMKDTFLRNYRKEIAEQVEDKMCYLNTCPNERDMILHIISPDDYPRLKEVHCNTDCWQKDCKSYKFGEKHETV